MIDEDFLIEFNGYEKDDIQQKNANIEAELRSYKSIDMICAENDVDPYDQPWSKVPLNDKVIQLIQSQQMGAMGGMPEGGEEEEEGFPKWEQCWQGSGLRESVPQSAIWR